MSKVIIRPLNAKRIQPFEVELEGDFILIQTVPEGTRTDETRLLHENTKKMLQGKGTVVTAPYGMDFEIIDQDNNEIYKRIKAVERIGEKVNELR